MIIRRIAALALTAALLAGCEALPAASSGPELPVGVAEITAAINARDTSSLATMLCPATRDRLDPLFGLTPAGDNIALRLVNSAVLSQLVIISAVVEDRPDADTAIVRITGEIRRTVDGAKVDEIRRVVGADGATLPEVPFATVMALLTAADAAAPTEPFEIRIAIATSSGAIRAC